MALQEKSNAKLTELFNKYKLDTSSGKKLLNITISIFLHPEFQKRMADLYHHHDKITLGRTYT